MSISEIYAKYFKISKRNDGSRYSHTIDGTPAELIDFICEIHSHFDALPNDWIYEQIHNAFEEYADYSDVDDFIHADCADVYNSELHKWSEEPYAPWLINEAIEDVGASDFYQQIQIAQGRAIASIRFHVADFIQAREEDAKEA